MNQDIDTLLNEYNKNNIVQIIKYYWQQKTKFKKTHSVKLHLHTVMNFLIDYSMLFCDESQCIIELLDLIIMKLKNKNSIVCFFMILILHNDKINQIKQIKYVFVVCHCNLFLCIMTHMTFYFFYWWNVIQELLLQFHWQKKWYCLHLIKKNKTAKLILYKI